MSLSERREKRREVTKVTEMTKKVELKRFASGLYQTSDGKYIVEAYEAGHSLICWQWRPSDEGVFYMRDSFMTKKAAVASLAHYLETGGQEYLTSSGFPESPVDLWY